MFHGSVPNSLRTRNPLSKLPLLAEVRSSGVDVLRAPVVVDCDSSRCHYNVGYSPCLTASRASNGGHWVVCRQRRFTLREMVRLMGVRPERVSAWERQISSRQMGHIVGNAVPVPLLEAVLRPLLRAAGLGS